MPSSKVRLTVRKVVFTNSVRSRYGHDLDVGRQDFRVQLGDFPVNPLQDFGGVLATQQLDDAGDAVVVVVLAQDALACQHAHLRMADVLHKNRRAAFLRDHDVGQILDPGYRAQTAHHHALFAAHNHTAAGIHVVRRNGILDVFQCEVVFGELGRINEHLELVVLTAERVDADHAGHRLEGAG